MTLLEAISQGAVPIAFDSYASVRDIIKNEEQLVTPYNIDEYVKKLVELADNMSLQERLRKKGYRIAECFSVKNIADNWEELLYSVIS